MLLKIKQFVVFITIISYVACKKQGQVLVKIEGAQFPITDSIKASAAIDSFMAPYSRHVNMILDSALSYAPYRIAKDDGHYNTTAGNLLADIILEEANPIFQTRSQRRSISWYSITVVSEASFPKELLRPEPLMNSCLLKTG